MAVDAMTRTRIETDSLGSLEIPADAYWGIHTARALENFPVSKRPDLRVQGSRPRARDGQAGLRARQSRHRRARRDQGRSDRPRIATGHRRAVPRPVRGRRHPGRRGYVDEHERERGDHQRRARARRAREGRLCVPLADRRHQSQSVHERRVPDRHQGGTRTRSADAPGRAGPAATGVPGQGGAVPRHPEGRAHAAAGCRAHDPGPGVPRLRHHARRGSQQRSRRTPTCCARSTWARRRSAPGSPPTPSTAKRSCIICARSPVWIWRPRPTWSNRRATPVRSCRSRRLSSAMRSSCRRSATTCGCSPPARRPGSARSTSRPVRPAPASCPARSTR